MNNYDIFDLITIIALVLGLQNLEENREQISDTEEILRKQNLEMKLQEEQNKKIIEQNEIIIKMLEDLKKGDKKMNDLNEEQIFSIKELSSYLRLFYI